MDPVIDNDWLGYNKNEPVDEAGNVSNIVHSWQWREHGIDPPHYPTNKTVLENMAEDILVRKPLKIRSCDLPGYPRSTFLMVFSPDGSKIASTHGNHNVYVSELASGKHVRILKGHPRTPWCIAFHPSHPQLIGSGCLGGQVRVWDIASGGSEVWNVRNETVIASIAFHPREQLLVIATHNELYFWDWSQSAPFTKVSTNNVNEKVRYVAFDALGYKLITGISIRANAAGHTSSLLVQQNPMGPTVTNASNNGRDDDDSSNGNRPDNPGSTQDMIVNSYHNLVQRYDSLVRNYQRLFRVRHRLVNTTTPPPPNTIDRGTDPMETDVSPGTSTWTRCVRPTASTSQDNATASSSRRQDSGDSGGEGSSSRLLNLDVLSINSDPSRNEELSPPHGHSIFGSRSSAFQPLSERRAFRAGDQNDNSTRLLPNPFSSSNNSPRPVRSSSDGLRHFCSPRPVRSSSDGLHQFFRDIDNSSRTSIFTSSRAESNRELFEREFLRRRWNSSPQHPTRTSPRGASTSDSTSTTRPSSESGTSPRNTTSVPGTSTQRPEMTNSATQMSPLTGPVDAQSINESLDLIRDILRDSGTRLLNLITNMSLSTLASVERNMPRRANAPRPHSDDSEGGGRPRPPIRPRVRLFSSSMRRDFLSSSSDSDSDNSLEVNIFRTRNSTFREDDTGEEVRPSTNESVPPDGGQTATDRMVFELNNNAHNEGSSQDFNVSVSRCRFRVRTQNNSTGEGSSSSRSTAEPSGSRIQNSSDFNPNRPSTSRDNFWTRSPVVPPAEACRKVRGGVKALQKHTSQLTNMWLRGNRTTMRELRTMWENLRRRVVMLHRATGRQEVPTYYTRTLIERCMMLSDLSGNLNTGRVPRSAQRNADGNRNTEESRNIPTDAATASPNNPTDNETNNMNDNLSDTRQAQSRRSPSTRSSPSFRISPSARRRLQASYRWRPEDELRRRSRNTATNRLTARYSRCRRDFARAIEISATRHEIRMRAMQVLSVMFNMMMMCLEERGLSQLITEMLRMLKKALALTCLMLMTNRNSSRSSNTPTPSTQNVDSPVVRIQNVDHTGPVNVDGPDDPASPHIHSEAEETQKKATETKKKRTDDEQPSTSQSQVVDNTKETDPVTPSTSTADQKWSNRLAVQIAAANRNTSPIARNRRDLYLESRRQKALHRTNPTAHPLIKKRALPPISTYRIPALRSLPTRVKVANLVSSRPRPTSDEEPVAGPSTAPPNENTNRESSVMNEFEHRVNLIRIAHMQAVSIRNAARNRFRRLQTIRLYTPSSVREMYALQTNNSDNQPGSRSPVQSGSETGPRRSFAAYTPMNGRSGGDGRPLDEFHTVLNSVAMPLMQVNDQPSTAENQRPQPPRFTRIHEYLQPIILAQNAMVVDVEGSGGETGAGGGGGGGARRMSGIAGLLDAGIIPESQPVPPHRVQAWDFTTGSTPDIADSTKNVVVQRCKIHNDASIDISKDGRLLVALLPVPRFRNTNHWLGVYSLEWARLGQCLHTAVLEQSAVSVALSPTARHLAVGLGSRRITTTPHARNNVFALLYKLEPRENSSRTGLSPIKELEQNWEPSFTSLNCIRWAPQPGQGLVYANNTGQLIIMS